jgi:hypothetical protein
LGYSASTRIYATGVISDALNIYFNIEQKVCHAIISAMASVTN